MVINRSQGGALLTALFIMTLVAIVATAMSIRLRMDIYRTQLLLNRDQLYLASEAVTFWGLQELNNPKNSLSKKKANGMVAVYPKTMSGLAPGFELSGGLYDLQALFNVNNISNNMNLAFFANLMHRLIPEINKMHAASLAFAVKDWITPYDPARGMDTLISWYLQQKPPYYPAHTLMQSPSELRLVRGIEAGIYNQLAPYLTALPEQTPVNINTVSKQVLMAFTSDNNESHVNTLLEQRNSDNPIDPKELNDILNKINLPRAMITTQSSYFLCKAEVRSDTSRLIVYSVLKRKLDKKNRPTAQLIRQFMEKP